MGEVMFRGNVVMKGYLKNKASTDKAFAGGWFHSGDLGVKHPDGYVQLRDRSKDIIISGGENISSIEVEDALFEHPGVQLAAVVARPDEKWGETPCAFVEMKPGHTATAEELIAWCRQRLAHYKCPRHDRVRRDPQDVDRQGAEIRPARAGEAARPAAGLSACMRTSGRATAALSLASSVASAAARFPGRGEDAPERVHGVRKALKESRALARLFLPSVGEPARVTIAALAVVRRRVGRARDLDVIEDRLERLAPPPDVAGPLTAAIERERAAAKRAHTGFATAASRAQLGAIVKRLEGWELGRVADGDIAEAVARTYRQGLGRGHIAFEGGRSRGAACLAVARRRPALPALALSPAWPAALNAQSEELNALRDTLGDFNDLHMLELFAAERAGLSPVALAVPTERIETRQDKLRRRAAIEFERLFAETPDAFAARLSVYLRHPLGKLEPARRPTPKRTEPSPSTPR